MPPQVGVDPAYRAPIVRWQWYKDRWYDYPKDVNVRIEQAFQSGRAITSVWDDSMMRELDFRNMRQMPGRRKLRRLTTEKGKARRAMNRSSSASALLGKGQEDVKEDLWCREELVLVSHRKTKTHKTPQRPWTPDPQLLAPSEVREGSASLRSAWGQPADDLTVRKLKHELVHGLFAVLPEVKFNFQEQITDVKPSGVKLDFVIELAHLYASKLKGKAPHLPFMGTEEQALNALVLGAYFAQFPKRLGEPLPGPSSIPSASSSPASVKEARSRSSGPVLGSRLPERPASAPGIMGYKGFAKFPLSRPSSAASLTRPPRPQSAAVNLREKAEEEEDDGPSSVVFLIGSNTIEGRALSTRIAQAWRLRRAAAKALGEANIELLHAAAQKGGTYEWLATGSNSDELRLERLDIGCETLWYATTHGSIAPQTTLFKWRPRALHLYQTPNFFVGRTHLEPIDAAVAACDSEARVGLLLCISAYMCGGQFLTGRRHDGLEEELCTRSNYYLALAEALRLAKLEKLSDSLGNPVHVPAHGALLAQDVDIFREGPSKGYAPLAKPKQLCSVSAISLPNLHPKFLTQKLEQMGPPMEYPDMAVYERMMQKKYSEALYSAIVEAKCTYLVVTDSGCEAYNNNPFDLGKCLGAALARFASAYLPTVTISGSSKFQYACRDAYDRLDMTKNKH